MTDHDFDLLAIRDPRLAVHATSPLPAWLWSIDGGRILWANPAGAQVFGARNGRELAARPIGEPGRVKLRHIVLVPCSSMSFCLASSRCSWSLPERYCTGHHWSR